MRAPLKKTSTNLILVGLLSIIMLIGIILIIANQFEQSSINLRKAELKRMVEIGIRSIDVHLSDFNSGKISREEAINRSASVLNLFTYEDETQPNYLFFYKFDGTTLVQPYEPDLVGSNRWDLQDSDGKYIVRELTAQALKEPGYVSYKYYPPGSNIPEEKISYVAGIPELECFVGTGIYSADINSIIKHHFRLSLCFILIAVAILIISAFFIIVPVIQAATYISAKFYEIGKKTLLVAPSVDAARFRKNKEAYNLVLGFCDVTKRLAERNQSLKKTAEERELMLKEVNHRIKNNLQIMISLLQLQLTKTKEDTIRAAFLETISRLESISIIHNMLYTNENYITISATHYLKALIDYIIHSFGVETRISVEYNIDETKLSIDQAVTIGIITNEIITNTVKYAYDPKEPGQIFVTLKAEEDRYFFSIKDAGRGLPDKYVNGGNDSLGIKLIQSLSSQLGSKLEIQNENGTTYNFIW